MDSTTVFLQPTPEQKLILFLHAFVCGLIIRLIRSFDDALVFEINLKTRAAKWLPWRLGLIRYMHRSIKVLAASENQRRMLPALTLAWRRKLSWRKLHTRVFWDGIPLLVYSAGWIFWVWMLSHVALRVFKSVFSLASSRLSSLVARTIDYLDPTFYIDSTDSLGSLSGPYPLVSFWPPTELPNESPYSGQRLPPGHIRLLRVLTNNLPIVQCELVEVDLADPKTSFDAISYTRGDPRPTRHISVNGKFFPTSNSVYEIVHDHASAWEGKLLWIDFVCIDQKMRQKRANKSE
jgi:hypothetical protein